MGGVFMNRVITIGRQYGSGGHEIGMKLAERLGIPFYDNELIELAAKESNLSEKFFEQVEDQAPPSRFFRPPYMVYQMPMSDQVFIAQSKVIKLLADKGPCVIVGRCANYVLKDYPIFSVFIHAPLKDRIQRKLAMNIDVPEEKMEAHIKTVDKNRKKYYHYYTDWIWDSATSYDLCINSGELGVDGCVELIVESLKRFEK